MRNATKEDIDFFMGKAVVDEDIYPYLTTSKYMGAFSVRDSDWSGVLLTNELKTFLLKVDIDRSMDNAFTISLYALNPFAAGRCITIIKELIKRYNPISIEAVVHSTNIKSIALNTKLMGEPWGVEPAGAWNMKDGKYEDLMYFRKLL